MNKMQTRLKQNTGASLAAALLVFLICALVGATILTAASATTGRIAGRRQSDKRYYAVTSAAKLFAEEIQGQSVTYSTQATVVTPYIIADGVPQEDNEGRTITLGQVKCEGESDLLKNIIETTYEKKDWESRYQDSAEEYENREFTMTLTGENANDETIVYGKVMAKDAQSGTPGQIEAVFSNNKIPSATEAVAPNTYFVRVTIPVTKARTSYTDNSMEDNYPTDMKETVTKETTVEWGEAAVREGR